MKRTRTTEIIIETDEIFILRKSGRQEARVLCEKCGREAELILRQPARLPEEYDHLNDSPKGGSNAQETLQNRQDA